jgi:hypothetical protein
MPVVINDFQVVADAPPERSAGGGGAEGEGSPPEKVDPAALARALRADELRALRVWAH